MKSGLEGVIAAETVLSHSDGERGILWVRGHTLPELVVEHGYEGAVALLWDGFAGNDLTRAAICAELGAAREIAFARLGTWLDAAAHRLRQLPRYEVSPLRTELPNLIRWGAQVENLTFLASNKARNVVSRRASGRRP